MKMNKLFMLCFMITVFSVAAHAQDSNVKFSVGGGISSFAPKGGDASLGFSIDFMAKKDLSESLEGFAQTGYNRYSNSGISWGVIPFLVGANYKAGSLKPGLGIGYGRWQTDGGGAGGFAFSPQLGYSLEKIDLVGYYTNITIEEGSINVAGLKVLYKF